MKRVAFFCFLSSLLLALLFYPLILNFLAAWSLKTYSISKWGKPMEYEKLSFNGHRLFILQPRLDDNFLFTAESISLEFNLNWEKRRLDVNIDAEQPHWHLQMPFSPQWEAWKEYTFKKEKWLKAQPHFRLNNALLTWSENDNSQNHSISFDVIANPQEGGLIKLHFDDSDFSTNCLALHAFRTLEGMQVNCDCQHLDCPSLFAFAQFVGGNSIPFSVTSGILQGQIKAILPVKKRPYLEGDLFMDEFAFIHTRNTFEGQIKQARFKLEKNQRVDDLGIQVPTIIGQMEILKPANIVCHSSTQEWRIDQLEGKIQLDNIETAWVDLEGIGGGSHWNLKGKANLNAHRLLNLDLNLSCSSDQIKKGNIHLSLSQPQEGELKQAELQIRKFSHEEYDYWQPLFAFYWPIFNEIKLKKGEINALLEAEVTRQGIEELYVKEFQASHVCFNFNPWQAACDCKHFRGVGRVNLKQKNFWQNVDASLDIEDAKIQFEGFSPHIPFTNIQAHFLIRQGSVDHSLVTLQLAGLKGQMDIEWGDQKQLLTFKLDGVGQDLAELLPSVLQKGLRQHFFQNRILVLANLKRQNRHLELGGTLHIQRQESDQMDLIHFGCELKKNHDASLSKFAPCGWFYANHLPLDKFLSPFIFRDGKLKVEGEAEVKGSFDDHYVSIKYDADNLKIKNEHLCIEIPSLHSPIPGQLVGSHQLDLSNYSHQGTLPITQASYFQKKNELLFQDIQGIVTFKDQVIGILPIEAYCEGVFFNGSLELDLSDPAPGVFQLAIHCPTIWGKVSQVQQVLSHLNQSSLLNFLPLEGEVNSKQEGLTLKFNFIPNDFQLEAEVQGTISDGFLPFEEADLALKGIDMEFNYKHQPQLLEFREIQGTLLVGKPRRVEEYQFIGPYVRIHQLAQPNIEIDVAVKDDHHELVRLNGYSQKEEEGLISLHVDPLLSHISSLYPKVWHCRLKDWSHVEQFAFDSQFDLKILLQDLYRFRQTGLVFFSHRLLDKLAPFLAITGQGSFTVNSQPDQSYAFQLEVSPVKDENSVEHTALLRGSKRDKKWIIDQFQWDDLNIYAELEQAQDKWKIPFLGLNAGEALLIGLNGNFIPTEGLLHAKLNFCEIDMAKLDRWNSFQSIMAKWAPSGNIKAIGEMEWNTFLATPSEGFKASLSAEVQNLSIRNYPLQVAGSFHLELGANQKIGLQDVHIEFPENKDTYIDLHRLEYDPIQRSDMGLLLSFHVPNKQLESVGKSLHERFPEFLSLSMKDLFIASKPQGNFNGNIALSQNLLNLTFDDGNYRFKGRDYDLKQFELQITDQELFFSAFSQLENYPFKMVGKVLWPSCQHGECILTGSHEERGQSLVIQWENQPQQEWNIHSMKGEFSRCSFHLTKNQEETLANSWMALQGEVNLDLDRLTPILSAPMLEKIQQLKLGSTYSFKGFFGINPNLANSLSDAISFKGILESKEAILKGYQFQRVQADLEYLPGHLEMKNLIIQDNAGSAKVESLIATRKELFNLWNIVMPQLVVKNLHPHLLRKRPIDNARSYSKFRTLMIKRIDLLDFAGEVGQQKSWKGKGSLHFLNPIRKNFAHPLFAIPAEIILRLGLDPQVLNPVKGTIDFDLQGDRFYLTRFKDMYSEGRGSKFYLAQSENPSWMDFDGNLSVQVGMKQYNLIFKLAELFTVSIQGNIKKPSYTLQRQSKSLHKR